MITSDVDFIIFNNYQRVLEYYNRQLCMLNEHIEKLYQTEILENLHELIFKFEE